MNFQIPSISDLHDATLIERLQHKIDNKTKPLGSLGRLEGLALQLGLILGSEAPELHAPQMLVCAGDHGLATRGVSAYPSDVTWQMVENFLAGGACVSVLARQHGITLNVADCGVRHDFAPRPGLEDRRAAPRSEDPLGGQRGHEVPSVGVQFFNVKVAYGTADSFTGPAMSIEQCEQALSNGAQIVKQLPGNVLLLGEMGIGNTSAASLLLARLGGLDIGDCTGAGTGLDAVALAYKTEVLREVLLQHPDARVPLQALAAFGGFEIATLAGAVLQAASERRVILVDGFIASAAVLVAARLAPAVLQCCVFAHRSGERGHALMLSQLQAQPLLDLGLRLGEGSGAALAWPLLVSACAVLREMASFESAGVSEKSA